MCERICLLIALLWIPCLPVSASPTPSHLTTAELDSLRAVESSQSGLDRLLTRIQIIKRHDLPDGGSYALADSIFEEAQAQGWHEQAAEAMLTKGHIYFQFETFDSALATYEQAYRYICERDLSANMYEAHGAIAGVYERWNMPDSAIHYALKDADYWREKDSTDYIWSLQRLSYYYDLYEKTFQKYDTEVEILAIGEAMQDSQVISSAYTQIACLLGKLNHPESARQYFQKALEINERHGITANKIVALSNGALFYKKQGLYRVADSMNRRALQIVEGEIKGKTGYDSRYTYFSSVLWINLATLSVAQESWDSTLLFARKSLMFSERSKMLSTTLLAQATIALAFANLDQVDSAQHYLDICKADISSSINPDSYPYYLLAQVAQGEATGDLSSSLYHLKAYHHLMDSLDNIVADNRMQFLNKRFLADQRDREILEFKLSAEQKSAQQAILIFLLILVLIMAIIALYFSASRARQNRAMLKKTMEVDKMKTRFFSNISHELRTPLSLIQAPVESLLGTADEPQARLLHLIKKNTQQLRKLIDQVLELTKIEDGSYQLRASQQNLSPYLRFWAASFQSTAAHKQIHFEMEVQESLIFYFQPDLIRQIINNLLGNALKFTPAGEHVKLRAWQEREAIFLEVTDTGPGIPAEHLPFIFDRFYQAEDPHGLHATGTGIGLALTKELTELHGGTIKVSSLSRAGSRFTLYFPQGNRHLREDQINFLPSPLQEPLPSVPTGINMDNYPEDAASSAPVVLIVEDQDDLRTYLKQELGEELRVLTASNGQEGFEIAKKEVPDLIITDLMMPLMDGLELTAAIKDHHITDHIPIIMLTARGESEDLLEGLQSRVDAYLTKPFHPIELRLRVRNMVLLGKKLRQTTSTPSSVATSQQYTAIEQQFLSRMHEVLDRELGNENLDVVRLAEDVNLSRSQLFRKLRTITGESPSSYLRKYRLTKAKELLETRQGTVSEVSYMVGFKSPSYFSKCFSDEFGKPPVHFTR